MVVVKIGTRKEARKASKKGEKMYYMTESCRR